MKSFTSLAFRVTDPYTRQRRIGDIRRDRKQGQPDNLFVQTAIITNSFLFRMYHPRMLFGLLGSKTLIFKDDG